MVVMVPRRVWKRQSPTQYENGDRGSIWDLLWAGNRVLNKISADRDPFCDGPTPAGDGAAVPRLLRTSEMFAAPHSSNCLRREPFRKNQHPGRRAFPARKGVGPSWWPCCMQRLGPRLSLPGGG